MATCRRTLIPGIVLLAATVTTSCTQIDNALASVPVFAFMRNSPSFDPYEHPLPPAPGSIPFESPNGPVLPPLQASEQALNEFAAGPWGRNPLAQDDPNALALGRVMYERHCSVCHGVTGQGDGPVVGPGRFPLAPSLVEAPATGRSDGYVYAVVRAGRGLMPAYGARMSHTERWAVVNYVNSLQARAGVAPQPTPAVESVVPGAAAPATQPGAQPPAGTPGTQPGTQAAPTPADTGTVPGAANDTVPSLQ